MFRKVEHWLLKKPQGLQSRLRIFFFKLLGMQIGNKNRLESGKVRKVYQIEIGNNNAFSHGYMLWPEDTDSEVSRIKIGDNNYFNRNLMLDACGSIEIGNNNMIGPDVYITDSNHQFGFEISPSQMPMSVGKVIIGNHCWIGAKAVILKDVELGDYCVVAAGAVVTKKFPSGSVIGGIPANLIK